MQKIMKTDAIRTALSEQGMTQKELANSLDVTPQAVTNWLKGKDFPRPAKLLKLASILRLTFDELVQTSTTNRPIVAFRKKGNAKTTQKHIGRAEEVGMLLKPLVSYLTEQQSLRTLITSPSTDYNKLQTAVTHTRARLGIGEEAELGYERLIGEFKNCGAILVPVLWGVKQVHENAMHIRLPEEDVTFIFLNLDTRMEDFKFWMAHELAHVYTPDLAGTEEGEDYADAFAGALLFPRACAEEAYHRVLKQRSEKGVIRVFHDYAKHHMISLNTVYQQVMAYTAANGLSHLSIEEKSIHAVRNSHAGALVSEALFEPIPPAPDCYIAYCENVFQSDFFHALKRMILDRETSSSYIQQILDSSVHDARALYEVLLN